MKKLILSLILIILFIFILFSIKSKYKKIDITVKGQSGCTYHVVGWINYDILPPQINCYNVTVTSNCGFKELFSKSCE